MDIRLEIKPNKASADINKLSDTIDEGNFDAVVVSVDDDENTSTLVFKQGTNGTYTVEVYARAAEWTLTVIKALIGFYGFDIVSEAEFDFLDGKQSPNL